MLPLSVIVTAVPLVQLSFRFVEVLLLSWLITVTLTIVALLPSCLQNILLHVVVLLLVVSLLFTELLKTLPPHVLEPMQYQLEYKVRASLQKSDEQIEKKVAESLL